MVFAAPKSRFKPRSLKVGFYNADGIGTQRGELAEFLRDHQLDVLLVQETFLKPSHRVPSIANYNMVRNDRLQSARGGTLIYYKRSLYCSPMDPPPQLKFIETSVCKLGMTGHDSIILVSAYLSPPGEPHKKELLKSDLEAIFQLGNSVLLAGDLNAKNVLWNCNATNRRGKILESILDTMNVDLISPVEPTHFPRIADHRPDILDVALLQNVNLRLHNVSVVHALDSDHRPVILEFTPRVGPPDSGQPPPTTTVTDWKKLSESLKSTESVHLDKIPNDIVTADDVVGAIDSLTGHVQSLISDCSRTVPDTSDCKWKLPEDVRELMRDKYAATRAHDTFPDDFNRARMRYYQRIVRSRIAEVRQTKWDQTLESLEPSHLAFWQLTRRLAKKTTVPMPPLNRPNMPPAFEDEEKTECLAESLANQCTPSSLPVDQLHLRNVDSRVEWFTTQRPLSPPPLADEEDPLPPTTAEEVKSIIGKLHPRKAPGPDKITNKVFKLFPDTLIFLLVAIFNAALACNLFPHQWKEAQVIGIHKPGKPMSEPTSYRPISLLSVMGKIYERLIYVRLKAFADAKHLIPDQQFGFRPGHSCVHQVHRLVEHISSHLMRGKSTGILFFDIAKAFDKVWHNGLLFKLITMGVPHRLVLILRDFLLDRHFRYRIEGALSSRHPIRAGVPQGSVLSPLLFTLFTSDMPHHKTAQVALFADDTAIFLSGTDRNLIHRGLQTATDALGAWCRKWRIEINPSKSQAVLFIKPRKLRPPPPPPVILFGDPIPWERQAKYLGVILDDRLSFVPHIQAVRARAAFVSSRLHCLLNAKSKLNLKSKVRLYTACIRPIMTYASPVFAHVAPHRIHRLQVIQNRFMRKATGAPWYMRNLNLHLDLGLPTIRQFMKRASRRFFDTARNHKNPLIVKAATYNVSQISKIPRPRLVLDVPDDDTTLAQVAVDTARGTPNTTQNRYPIYRPRRRGPSRRPTQSRPQ